MVPDWTGSLQEGEIYLHSSESFIGDDLSMFAGLPLLGVDVLVARMPAHFASDVQKVRAVFTKELFGLRDVVVFSTKGECLAAKLSGGDYDGDQAWICWESSIVDSFNNTKVPKQPDLVKLGFIKKDTITYRELVRGAADPIAVFLNYCMEFNLQLRILAICTSYKEQWCYSYESIACKEAVWLSKLLSDLVDLGKAGYTFTEADWEHFKKEVLGTKTKVKPLRYKDDGSDPKAKHIIDRLKHAANITIQKTKTQFHESLPKTTSTWDNDLAEFATWVRGQAAVDSAWLSVIKKLRGDLEEVKKLWAEKIGSRSGKTDVNKPAFGLIVQEIYEKFKTIQPAENNQLTRSLLSYDNHPELSPWALLRASQLSATYTKWHVSNLVWYVSGIELCHIKAKKHGIITSITPGMYAMLEPDSTHIKLRVSENQYKWGAGVLEGEGKIDDDDD